VLVHHVPQTLLLRTFFFSSFRVPQENEGSTGIGPTSSVSVNMQIIQVLLQSEFIVGQSLVLHTG
jgi:hypothetical protein